MNTNNIEQILRKAQQPSAPSGLLNNLKTDIQLPHVSEREVGESSMWLRRWIPALGFAAWFLGCVIVLGVQTSRIANLKERARASQIAANKFQATADQSAAVTAELESLRKDLTDLARLHGEVERLRNEVAELPKLQAENAELRRAVKATVAPPGKPEEDFFAQKERAVRTRCVNSLKQFCLAARVWANDAKTDAMPNDAEALKPYLAGAGGAGAGEKILFCPAEGKTPYQILSPGASESRPNVVFVRCPIHNLAGLVDGSVHGFDGDVNIVQRNAEWVIERITK
ncbi:MAG TPA: hypothetical protein VK530_15095 [Candidatus Acidoferrum sp.]|nr:hypothetical protein [Candidatus Acidoferrum sp.]